MKGKLVVLSILGAAAGAAILLVSGPPLAEAQNQAAPLACNEDIPTYYPRGDHWAAYPDGAGPSPISYRISLFGPTGIALGTAQGAIENAMAEWMSVRCAVGSCDDYDNCTSGTPDRAEPNVRVIRGEEDYPGRDGGDSTEYQNIVYFVENNWNNHAGSEIYWDDAILAMTSNFYTTGSFYLVHADMAFNDEDWKWRVEDTAGCTADTADCFDLETVALHEFGHFLGLNHVNCTDSVMYATGNPSLVRHDLTEHEKAGLCAIYPPRPAEISCPLGSPDEGCRTFGEQCENANQCCNPCPDGGASECVHDPGYPTKWAKCTRACTTTDDCPVAHTCESRTVNSTTLRICLPGPNFEGSSYVTGGGTCDCDTSADCDPDFYDTTVNCYCDFDCTTTGQPPQTTTGTADKCAPCSAGDQCLGSICVGDGVGTGICTEACLPGSDCGIGWNCLETDAGWSVCWPEDETVCAAINTVGAQLNEWCFAEAPAGEEDWYNPCGADLICFGFQPRCVGMWGACVNYCNSVDRACPDSSLICCYGVDESGACVKTPPTGNDPGGCFNLRREGESCVFAENSVCHDGMECVMWADEDSSLAKCYRQCSAENPCAAGSTCYHFDEVDLYANVCDYKEICCDDEGAAAHERCLPGASASHYEIGVECTYNEDCDSGLCLKFEGGAACSRGCRPGAGNGCPGEADINGDGMADGGFTCRVIDGEGFCWPDEGPAAEPGLAKAQLCAADPDVEGCEVVMDNYCFANADSAECDAYCEVKPEVTICKDREGVPGCDGCAHIRPGGLVGYAVPFLMLLGWRWRRRRH